jgi:hypothetical protein
VSDDAGYVDHPAPSGFNVYRGAELVGVRKCILCPSRSCWCLLEAFDLAKKVALLRGGSVTVETIEGVELSKKQRATSLLDSKRSGPAKPPKRRARAETIPPPPPSRRPTTEELDDGEDEEQIA